MVPIEVDGAKLRLQQGGDALKRCNCPRTREATTTTMEISEPFSTAFVKSRKTAVVKSSKTKKQKISRKQPGPYTVSKSKNFPPINNFRHQNLRRRFFWSITGRAPRPLFIQTNRSIGLVRLSSV